MLSRLELFFRLWSGDRGGLATFLLLFLAGLFVAAVLETLRRQNREIAKNAFRTELLLENSRKLRRCRTKREVWESLAAQAGSLMRLPMILYPVEETGILGEPMTFSETGEPDRSSGRWENPRERAVAQWVAANRRRAGATTHTLPNAAAIYLPIPDARKVRGVLGILLEERRPIKDFEYGLLVAMLNETGVKLQDMGREE